MANEWQNIQGDASDKYQSHPIDYTFLTSLPDYYFSALSYATWFDDFVDTTVATTSYSASQKNAIYYILEPVGDSNITGNYDLNEAYRVSFADVVTNITFNEEAQTAGSPPTDQGVGHITFRNVALDQSVAVRSNAAFTPDNNGIGNDLNGWSDIFTDRSFTINNDNNLDLGQEGFTAQLHELIHAVAGFTDIESGNAL